MLRQMPEGGRRESPTESGEKKKMGSAGKSARNFLRSIRTGGGKLKKKGPHAEECRKRATL